MEEQPLLTTVVKVEPFELNDKCAEVYRNSSLGTYRFLCHACDKMLDSAAADDIFRHLDNHYYFEGQEKHYDTEQNAQKELESITMESFKAEEECINPVESHQTEFIDVNFPIVVKISSNGTPISDQQLVKTEKKVNICDISLNTFTFKIDHLKEHTIELSENTTDGNNENDIPLITDVDQYGVKKPEEKSESDDRYQCEKCNKVYKDKSYLKMHYETHLEYPPVHECDICHKKYSGRKTLRQHKRRHEKKNLVDTMEMFENFICDICQHTFTSKSDLMEHLQKLHITAGLVVENNIVNTDIIDSNNDEDIFDDHCGKKKYKRKPGQYPCEKCGKIFKYKSNLKDHYESHLEIRPEYECDICNKKYYRSSSLRKHKLEHPFLESCKTCNETFTKRREFRDHQQTHLKLSEFKCEVCQKIFTKRDSFRQHKLIHRPRAYPCTVCDKKFKTKQTHLNHIRTHTGEKPYECTACQKRFITLPELRGHFRIHTGDKPHQCEQCGKNFSSGSGLGVHTKRVHKNEKPHKCQFCEEKFTFIAQRTQHERKHTGERPYGCKVCGLKFRTAQGLRQHSILHTGDKPYKCKYCDLKFAQNAGRRGHEKSKHGAV